MKGYKVNKDNVVSATEGRRRIFELIEKVQKAGSYFVMTEHGKPKAVLLSAEWFESLMETLEIVEDFPRLTDELHRAREEYMTGKAVSLEQFLTHQPAAAVADKGGKKYAVSRRIHKTRPKRTRKTKKS